ncbi:MAG: tmRNA-binding protein SmpB, partial [uncultured Gemmatimonadetes bacterium]
GQDRCRRRKGRRPPDRLQPQGALRVPRPQHLGDGDRAAGHGGEGAARREGEPSGRLRARGQRGGVALQRAHLAVRAGEPLQPRPPAPPQAPAAPLRDPQDDRRRAGEGAHAGAARPALQRRARQGEPGPGARQAAPRQARHHPRAGSEARDPARVQRAV